jgi:hypothetical protein
MPDASQHTHPDDIQSDLDLLVAMVNDAKQDEQAIHRHLESLKKKLDQFIQTRRTHSGGGSAS